MLQAHPTFLPQREDAYWFPVLGSCALFGLFLAFKFLPKVWVNRVLGVYMATMAVAGLARTGVKVAQKVVPEERWKGLNKVRFLPFLSPPLPLRFLSRPPTDP